MSTVRIRVCGDGVEHTLDDRGDIAAELAGHMGAPATDVHVDQVDEVSGGAWLTVRIFAPVSSRGDGPVPEGLCRMCSRGFSPTHDIHAPGLTARHPFMPRVTR